jgi:hypothetical protein
MYYIPDKELNVGKILKINRFFFKNFLPIHIMKFGNFKV